MVTWQLCHPGSRVDPTHPLCDVVAGARELAGHDSRYAARPGIEAFPSARPAATLLDRWVDADG